MTRETKQQIIGRLTREISELNACYRQKIKEEKTTTAYWVRKFYAVRWLLWKKEGVLLQEDWEAIVDYIDALEKVASVAWYAKYMGLPEFKHCARAYAADTTLNPAKLLMDALEDERAVYKGDNDG